MSALFDSGLRQAILPTLGGWPRHTRLVMAIALYLDDSDSHDQAPVQMLAGFISTIDHWAQYEIAARKIYCEAGICYLRGKEFHHNRKQFEGWDNTRKRKFVDQLFGVARPLVGYGIAFGTLKGRYEQLRKASGLNKNIPALGFCLWGIVNELGKDEKLQAMMKEQGATISIIVESGNDNNASLRVWVDRIRRKFNVDWLPAPTEIDKKVSPAVQLADFLAFYASRRVKYAGKTDPAPDWWSIAFDGLYIHERLATDFGG